MPYVRSEVKMQKNMFIALLYPWSVNSFENFSYSTWNNEFYFLGQKMANFGWVFTDVNSFGETI
jgi:hypothetical protein